jgi:transposase-like protein
MEEEVKQVIDKGHTFVDLTTRLGIAEGVLYSWVSKFKKRINPNPTIS